MTDNSIRMFKHSRLDQDASASHTVVTVVFKDKSRYINIPDLGRWNCRLPMTGRLHRYDFAAGASGHVIVIVPKFGSENGILLRFEICEKILISVSGTEWIDLVHERERMADTIASSRAEAEARATAAAALTRKRERQARKWKQEQEQREAEALIERNAARLRARERAYEQERETEIETALRQAIGDQTAVVAMTDDERTQLKRAAIVKLLGPQRTDCYHRLVWPGIGASQFSFGPAPAGRPQYQIRFHPRVELRLIGEAPTPRKLWTDPETFKLDVPERGAIWDRPWDACPDVAPPGYPDTTPYQRARSNILGKQHIRSLRQTDASIERAVRKRGRADDRSLLWQVANANRAEYLEQQRREREAEATVARMSQSRLPSEP